MLGGRRLRGGSRRECSMEGWFDFCKVVFIVDTQVVK